MSQERSSKLEDSRETSSEAAANLKIAKALFVADNWRRPDAAQLWDGDPDWIKEPYLRMSAALLPLFAEAQAEALREAADHLEPAGVIWWGEEGATVQEDGYPIRLTKLATWLRSRATHIEGRALVARIHERKAQG